jgi:hypothetical protein
MWKEENKKRGGKSMSRYTELKFKHQAEVDAFPLGFAFSEKQFNEMMEKWGLTPDDTDKIYHIGMGGYVRKSDAEAMHEMFDRHAAEHEAAMQDDEYLFSMFNYELANHEFCITYDLTDTLDALGLTAKEIIKNYRMSDALYRAIINQCDGDVVHHLEQRIEENKKSIEQLKREKEQFEMRLRAIAANERDC